MTFLLWLATLACLVGSPSLLQAQGEAPTLPPTQLPAVEVVGQTPAEQSLSRQTSTFATAIDTQEATARVDSVADVLAESVGVQVRRFGGLGSFSTVSIRGSTPNQVEVYVDHVRLNQANVGLVDLGDLPLDNVERIEVYRGFAPLQLGAGSIGGAINLVTRPVAGDTINRASASYGSFDTRKFTLYRSQGFDALGYVVLFNYTESDGDYTFVDDNGTPFNAGDDEKTTRTNNDFRSFNLNAKGTARLNGWDLTVLDDAYTKEQGVPGRASLQSEDANLTVWRNLATLRLERSGFPWIISDIALQLAHLWQREAFEDPEGEIGTGVQENANTANTFSVNALLDFYLEQWHQVLSTMLEWRYETFRVVDQLPELRDQAARQGPLQRRASMIVALQDELRLFDERLALRPLLRYQFVASDFGAQPGFGSVALDTDRDDQDHLFSPSLGLTFRLMTFLDLKANVGRFQRVPTLFELFGDRGTTLGNPNLEPESSLNWDVGLVLELRQLGILDRVYFEYAYFGSNVDDLIVFVQNSQATAQARNIGAAELRGHELSWSVTVLGHARLFGNYTLQDTEDTSNTFSRGNRLPGRPRHELHQAIELFAGFGKLVYEFDYIADNALDRANAFVVESRTLHNVRVVALPFGERLKLTFEAKNITDNQVEDFRGFPLPGRSFFGTVEGRF